MKTTTRRIFGVALLGLALAVALALYFSGTPLLSFGQWHTTSFPNGAVASGSVEVHWPFIVVCITGFLGFVALIWPQRRPPRLLP